jgi:cell division septal protein FtsQ
VAGRRADFAVRRRPRRPRRPLILRGLAALVLAAAAAGLGWWLLTSPLFAVTRVETGAYRFTAADDLEDALGALLGRNIWRVGQGDAETALAGLPWIRDLRLARRLPSTAAVEFTEWTPLVAVAVAPAQGAASSGLHVLVADGRVLVFPAHLPAPGLPVLTGVAAARDTTGALRLAESQLPTVLSLLDAVAATGLEAAAPVDFLVARSDGFAIVLQDGRGTLLVGREEFAGRLQRYMVGRDHLEDGLEIDLRFRDKITVRRPDQPRP